jgi:UDP-N-acetylglucosamine/UDP-N-acetylgalactosamine diphosphorylase
MLPANWVEAASKHGQEHLLKVAEPLASAERFRFDEQLRSLNFEQLHKLYQQAQQKETAHDFTQCEAPEIVRIPRSPAQREKHVSMKQVGEAALKNGEVAIILVAGGQGTRLGHEGPKGTYPIGPASNRSLFQIHAEKVLALSLRYETNIPLLIMTSQENDQATRDFFAENAGFGIHRDHIHFFTQGMLPALDASTGKVLLKSESELALSPNGHGGVIDALQSASLLDKLAEAGIKHCFYFQVDNPLVKIADPTFLGYHIDARAQMSLKVLAKLNAHERMGNLVKYQNRLRIIEYTELPKEVAEETIEFGELRIWAGSPAIHCFDLEFLQQLGRGDIELPYHVAHKAVPYFENGQTIKPEKPNAYKFERFVFDALPLAERTLAMETTRLEEFEPLKNAEGDNSPESVRRALTFQYVQWMSAAGIKVPVAGKGIEISPLVAMDADDLIAHTILKGKEPEPEPTR